MASPSPTSSENVDWNELRGATGSPSVAPSVSANQFMGLGEGPLSLVDRLFPSHPQTAATAAEQDRVPTEEEDRLLMTLWLLTDTSWSEKQRALKKVYGFEHRKHVLHASLAVMKTLVTPPLWQPHWDPQQPFVTMHRPSQWTYLEIKLLRICLAFPPPDPARFDYGFATSMMNRAKYQDRPHLPCWRPGGPYTVAEVELCASFMLWRLPGLAVRSTAQWTFFDYSNLCLLFRVETPLATIVKTMCTNPNHFVPQDGVDNFFDRLSVEKGLDNLMVGPRFGPPVTVRRFFPQQDQVYFGMCGPDAPGLGPNSVIWDGVEVMI